MTRQEIIDKYWEEYLDFVRVIGSELADKQKSASNSDLFSAMLNPTKFLEQKKLEMLENIGEHSFWQWYIFVKPEVDKAKKDGKL